jgi:hypothetical protein
MTNDTLSKDSHYEGYAIRFAHKLTFGNLIGSPVLKVISFSNYLEICI